jgi:hypothetical protein
VNGLDPALPPFQFVVECRWEDLFIRLVTELYESVDGELLVVDSNGVVWMVPSLDVNTLVL